MTFRGVWLMADGDEGTSTQDLKVLGRETKPGPLAGTRQDERDKQQYGVTAGGKEVGDTTPAVHRSVGLLGVIKANFGVLAAVLRDGQKKKGESRGKKKRAGAGWRWE